MKHLRNWNNFLTESRKSEEENLIISKELIDNYPNSKQGGIASLMKTNTPEKWNAVHAKNQYIIEKDRAFVGIHHGKKPKLPKEIVDIIKSIGDKWGYWAEGDGGDSEVVDEVFGDIEYKGSWDDYITEEPIEHEKDYLYCYCIFSNTKENKTIQKVIAATGDTVYEKILNSYKETSYKHDSNRTKKEYEKRLTKFLKKLGKGRLEESRKMIGTPKNVRKFITEIEEEMWGDYPRAKTNAAKMALELNLNREKDLIKKIKKGVIFIGNSHLVFLKYLI